MRGWNERLSGPAGGVAVLAALAALLLVLVPAGQSTDLRALWLAAAHFAAGDTANVYPPVGAVFTMAPPPAWEAAHPGEDLYPYLYPPLWAALAAPVTAHLPFETLAGVMRVLNALMLAGTLGLAWRVTGARLPFPVFAMLGALILSQTFAGSLALMENQPQIAVSFLVLLALDRLKAGAATAAGAALALAAALKVYPVLFALLWLATGERRATAAFALAGAALAALSVGLAGWALHETFLATLASIANTVLLTPVSYGLTPAVAQIAARGAFVYQEAAHGGWLVMALPPVANALARALLLAVLAALALAMRRAAPADRWALLWPAALLAVSLLGPLSWAYHYIPALACAPVLLDRLGARAGGVALALVVLPLSTLGAGLALDAGLPAEHLQIAGTLALSALALFCAGLVRGRSGLAA